MCLSLFLWLFVSVTLFLSEGFPPLEERAGEAALTRTPGVLIPRENDSELWSPQLF